MMTFIFDLDGTLLDTLEDIGTACNEILKRHGWPEHEISSYRNMVGNGFTRLVERALPPEKKMPNQSALTELVEEAKQQYANNIDNFTRPYPEMETILSQLVKKNISLAVLSNKPDNLSQILVKHFFPIINFLFIRGATPGIPLKPDPAALDNLIKSHKLDLANTVYIGDSNVDMEFAHNSKLLAAGACWGFRGRDELEKSGADILLHDPKDLLELSSDLMNR